MIIKVTLNPTKTDDYLLASGKPLDLTVSFNGDFLAVVDNDGELSIVERASGSDFYDEDVLFCFAPGSWRYFGTDELKQDDSGYYVLRGLERPEPMNTRGI